MKNALVSTLAIVAMGVLPGLGAAQVEQQAAVPAPAEALAGCATVVSKAIDLAAPPPSTATPHLPDFPSTCSGGFEPRFAGTLRDRCFRHTFTWSPPSGTCSCLGGGLTIKYRALLGGQSATAADAGNDGFAAYKGGVVVAGTSQPLYQVFPFAAGQAGTKQIVLSCAALSANRLSFLVQDDTAVESVTLRVHYTCCLPCPPGKVEGIFPGTTTKYCCEGKPGDSSFCCSAQPAG